MQQKRFVNKGLKAHKLYAETPLFKAVLLVAIPGLLISLMSGIYVFADQLLLSILVPADPMHNFKSIYGDIATQAKIENLLEQLNELPGNNYFLADTSTIVKSAVAITLPIMVVINAVPNIAAIGASSMYGQCIAKDNKPKALQIWKSTFYCAIAIGLLSSIIFFSINDSLLHLMSGKAPHFENAGDMTKSDLAILNAYFERAYETQINWSHEFLDILSWSSILNVFILYFSFMVRVEGKLWFVTTAEMCCNFVNIIFDYVYISLCHAGMMGGGLATLTGWSINVVVYTIYIWYLGKKGETWMKYRDLLPKNGSPISYTILVPIIIIGLSVFLRNFTNSIANAWFLAMLANVATKTGADAQYWQSISGIVWPVGSLFFYAIFGIADGVRTLVAYNYGRSFYSRIRRTYWYATLISFIYGAVIYTCLATFLGAWLINLFPNMDPAQYTDAINYMRIQVLFIPAVALSIGGLLMFQATNQMAMANFIAVMQAAITFPIAAGVIYPIALVANGPMTFVIANPLNTGSAGIIITIISLIYLYKYLGKTRVKVKVNTREGSRAITLAVPSNIKKLSYAERELQKSLGNNKIATSLHMSTLIFDGKKNRKIKYTAQVYS